MKITKELQANYVEILMAVGTSRDEKGYLPVNLLAEAIAKGIKDDLPYLIKELEMIDPKKLWKLEVETPEEEAERIKAEAEYENPKNEIEETIGYAIKKGLISEEAIEWTDKEKKDYCDKSDVLGNEKED